MHNVKIFLIAWKAIPPHWRVLLVPLCPDISRKYSPFKVCKNVSAAWIHYSRNISTRGGRV